MIVLAKCEMCPWALTVDGEFDLTDEELEAYGNMLVYCREIRLQHEHTDHHQGHYDVGPWCNLCRGIPPSEFPLLAHQAREHGDAVHECEYCGRRFETPLLMYGHFHRRHMWLN